MFTSRLEHARCRGRRGPVDGLDREADLPNVSATRWRTVADTTSKVYSFESTISPNLVWVNLADLDLSEGSGILQLDIDANLDRIGDCTSQLVPTEAFMLGSPDLS